MFLIPSNNLFIVPLSLSNVILSQITFKKPLYFLYSDWIPWFTTLFIDTTKKTYLNKTRLHEYYLIRKREMELHEHFQIHEKKMLRQWFQICEKENMSVLGT